MPVDAGCVDGSIGHLSGVQMKQRNVQWLVVAAAVSAASIASAQNETGGLEEVTVTAQRREQSLQDVPIAITAFTSEQLARRNIVDTYDLVRNIPNLTGNNNVGVGTSSSYYIRGIGNGESIATFDVPVGTYVDDVYIARQNQNNFSMFDVERIEVLRGPQGTLFGRNTTGGAINIVMKKPGASANFTFRPAFR
ncbi:MAG: Plug domain-containing protein [Gammaproteobacteria bacterium]|nr:Plug domain-containing protein [Gammaproteobacteria bacterium]